MKLDEMLLEKKAQERLDFIEAVRQNDKLLKYPKDDASKFENLDWAKFKIVVPNQREKEKVQMALKYLHDSDIDTNFVWVNQIVHCYEDDSELLVIEKDLNK